MTCYESLRTLEAWMEDARECFASGYPGSHWPAYVYTDQFAEAMESLDYLKKYFSQGVKAES
jgi:hypothetical protein